MANLDLWEKVRAVPSTALKQIGGGRLKGMSDINPVWRQKKLTELFGMCGVGWKYVITKQWLEAGGNDEISAFVNIDLFVKAEGEWSEAIPGTGGSAYVAKEKSGLYVSDECFKMALTDAISVSCKALGFGADVYWDKDSTKYNKPQQTNGNSDNNPKKDEITPESIKTLHAIRNEKSLSEEDFKTSLSKLFKREIKSLKDLTDSEAQGFVKVYNKRMREEKASA
jgi:hypothetical protein